MKCATIICAFAVVLMVALANSNVSAAAIPDVPNTLYDVELSEQTHQEALESHRTKRATCDLASGFGVGSSLCAAHCLALRKRGGYCNPQGVCVCRN
ncbi:defensin [Anopheles nili]|uniref:defensin n=1 Tax=Anopheles nili TaxID=185578 RepID=UPI00237B6740|nr:defensin [Anopheles nili]